MKLFEVTNTYIGESYVRCLVIAESPEMACEMARPRYEAKARGRFDYANPLTATLLCDDVTQPWSGEVTDG